MKKRFRYFVRKGWKVVEVPRKNLYDYENDPVNFGNTKHYLEIRKWCDNMFPKDTWEGTLHSDNTMSHPGVKRFAFREHKYASMFILKWL